MIVEDIVDSGHTLAWLVEELKRRGAASVEVFALLSKPSRREVDVDVKYAAMRFRMSSWSALVSITTNATATSNRSRSSSRPFTKECKHEFPPGARFGNGNNPNSNNNRNNGNPFNNPFNRGNDNNGRKNGQ